MGSLNEIPVLEYFKIRARGEPIRLALYACGQEFDDLSLSSSKGTLVDLSELKAQAGTARFPFGQLPMYEDGVVRLSQMDAILRHIGRTHNMYGQGLVEQAKIDEILGAVEDIRKWYGRLIYMDKLGDQQLHDYISLHMDTTSGSMNAKNGGAHFVYLQNYLKRNENGEGFIVGKHLSIADIQLFDIIDVHLRPCFATFDFAGEYPLLMAYHDRIAKLPKIAEYINSGKRHEQMNGVPLG